MNLMFYSGQDCHLCDLALALLQSHAEYASLTVTNVNVREDHALYHSYGARIPVLKRTDTGEELGWPFDAEMLEQFLK